MAALVFLLSVRLGLVHLVPLIHRRTACLPVKRTRRLYPYSDKEDEALHLLQGQKGGGSPPLGLSSWLPRGTDCSHLQVLGNESVEVKCMVPALKADSFL